MPNLSPGGGYVLVAASRYLMAPGATDPVDAMSYGRHRVPREPRWHDRPRAWLAAALHWLSGSVEDWDGTDDNGEPIAEDLPPVPDDDWHPGINGPWLRPWERVGLLHDRGDNAQVIRTAKVSGVHLLLSGDNVNWTVNCAFATETWMRLGGRASRECQPAPVTHWQGTSGRKRRPQTSDRPPETPRPGGYNPTVEERHGPTTGLGYRQNVPRRGREVTAGPRRDHLPAGSEDRTAPGHLSMWDLAYVRSPWPPRPDDTVIISAPRVCAGRITLLAGGW